MRKAIKRSEMTEEQREKARATDREHYKTPHHQAYRERYYQATKDMPFMKENYKKYAEKHAQQRIEVLKHYGTNGVPICVCCGEDTMEFMCLDHINGGGRQHRIAARRTNGGGGWYNFIIKSGYPPLFQILCCNCNWSKGMFGYCPHQRKHPD